MPQAATDVPAAGLQVLPHHPRPGITSEYALLNPQESVTASVMSPCPKVHDILDSLVVSSKDGSFVTL